MSNFNQLKNMWENKVTLQTNALPPMKPLPQKFKIINVQPSSGNHPELSAMKKQSSEQESSPTIQITLPMKSVANLKNNLEGKIKLGQNNPYSNPYQNGLGVAKHQLSHNQPNSQRLSPREPDSVQYEKQIPNFKQSKMILQQVYAKKNDESNRNEKANRADYGDSRIPSSQFTQSYLDPQKQQQLYDKITPQQRTQQIMHRIFSQASSLQFLNTQLHHNQAHNDAFLLKQEQATNLALRNKKEKRSFNNFDEV